MRTTLNLDDRLIRAAKSAAAERGVTLTRIIEEALRAELAAKPPPGDYRLRLPVVSGRRPPGVDISDREALYAFMEDSADR